MLNAILSLLKCYFPYIPEIIEKLFLDYLIAISVFSENLERPGRACHNHMGVSILFLCPVSPPNMVRVLGGCCGELLGLSL